MEKLTVEKILNDPAASDWLKEALRKALLCRDPLDAANDAEFLAQLLRDRCLGLLGQGSRIQDFSHEYYERQKKLAELRKRGLAQ